MLTLKCMNMKKILMFLLASCTSIVMGATSKDTDKQDTVTVSGLLTFHKVAETLYMELPLNLLGRDMLLGSTVSAISDNENAIVGSKPKDPMPFSFSVSGKKLCMELPSDSYILKGMKSSASSKIIKPIYQTFDIKEYKNDSTSLVVDVTELFLSDDERFSPFDEYSANVSSGMKRSEMYNRDLSYRHPTSPHSLTYNSLL